MKCSKCSATHPCAVGSRHADEANAIRRRHGCENCGTGFTTFEHVEVSPLIAVRKDDTCEQFLREKILNGLVRSCEERPIRYQQSEDITNKVEWQLYDKSHTEISSRDIGEYVTNSFTHVDQVSYVRFTSVYKEFKDMDQLLASMQDISDDNKRSDS